MRRWRFALPSVVTALGLAAGVAGVALWPEPLGLVLLVVSVVLDIADGAIARRLRAVTEAGGSFDWSVDVALAHVIGYRVFGLTATVLLIAVQVILPLACWRVSGRAAVSAVAIFWQLMGVF